MRKELEGWMMELKIEELWYSTRQDDWLIAENCYWNQVSDANRNLEKLLEMLNPDDIKHMNVETFYLCLEIYCQKSACHHPRTVKKAFD